MPGSNTSSPSAARTGRASDCPKIWESRWRRAAQCRHFEVPDHLGWHEQGDGKLYLGVPVASGRIVDGERIRIRTALREIVAPLPRAIRS